MRKFLPPAWRSALACARKPGPRHQAIQGRPAGLQRASGRRDLAPGHPDGQCRHRGGQSPAVAAVGFMMLTGRLNWRYGATVILGCFVSVQRRRPSSAASAPPPARPEPWPPRWIATWCLDRPDHARRCLQA
ncbi:hypothetical protein ACRAWD_04400 [Caulobacter segnis]